MLRRRKKIAAISDQSTGSFKVISSFVLYPKVTNALRVKGRGQISPHSHIDGLKATLCRPV